MDVWRECQYRCPKGIKKAADMFTLIYSLPFLKGGLEGMSISLPQGTKKREEFPLFFCAQDKTRTCTS